MLIISLLGRRDHPTDGVVDYCRFLSQAFASRGIDSAADQVNWEEVGWGRALWDLWRKSATWRGDWTLVQYTALMWSRHGFSFGFLLVLLVLRLHHARMAMVFHDPEPYSGQRLVDRLRRACQLLVVRLAYRLSDRSILNVPLESVSWLSPQPKKANFIPVAANIPLANCGKGVPPANANDEDGHATASTIAVFAITDAGDISREVADIAFAATAAAERLPRVRLLTLGRGSVESEASFRQALKGSPVEFNALGILPAAEVSRVLSSSDVSLFVRGTISTRRGSAMASIACGVPLVAYADAYLPAPLAEAGVLGVRYRDREALAGAAVRVLSDRKLWAELHNRSGRAHQTYFSWEAVAARFVEVLNHA